MSAIKEFKSVFSTSGLLEIYLKSIQQGTAVGIDRINRKSFEASLNQNIQIISRKVLDGTYKFSYFQEKLILKGRSSNPRLISIPTIRDRIVLKSLNRVLQTAFGIEHSNVLVHEIISDVKTAINSGDYTHFIKIDVENFYPSIDHNILLRKLRARIRTPKILTLFSMALRKQTVSGPADKHPPNEKGIAQGLSISNLLANIYFLAFDSFHKKQVDYKYFRYVDDILILCNEEDIIQIKASIKNGLESLALTAHRTKSESGELSQTFGYLGYVSNPRGLSVRKGSIEKIKLSLLKSIVQFKYSDRKNYDVLNWRLNLRITGCRFDEKKYGWLFFFSQIDDLSLLFHLDCYVTEICTRYGLDPSMLELKRFVRTYHEITKNLTKTHYIPNFDDYDLAQKRRTLFQIFNLKSVASLNDVELEAKFRRVIFRSVRDLERDISRGS